MSDKRTIYAIGAIVAAFALVFGMVAGSTSLTTISVSSQDPLQMSGHVIITLADADGDIKAYRQTDNVVVHDGMDCSADLIFGDFTGTGLCSVAAFFTSIAIGSSGAGLDIEDFELISEITASSPARAGALDDEAFATGTTGAKKTIVGEFTIGTGDTVREVGLFDSATSEFGNMFSRLLITPEIPVLADDTITITYIVEVG